MSKFAEVRIRVLWATSPGLLHFTKLATPFFGLLPILSLVALEIERMGRNLS